MPVLRFFDGARRGGRGARATIGPRLAAVVGVGLIALAFLPLAGLCSLDHLLVGGVEIVGWFATADQFFGRPVSIAIRLCHAATLVSGVTGWVALGVLLWRTGSAAGAVCAVAAWLSVMGFAQVYAYQSRAGYLLSGVIPALAMLITPLAVPNPALPGVLPVWLLLLVSVAFAVSGARQTMAARRRYEDAAQSLRAGTQLSLAGR